MDRKQRFGPAALLAAAVLLLLLCAGIWPEAPPAATGGLLPSSDELLAASPAESMGTQPETGEQASAADFIAGIPPYSGEAYIEINGSVPFFSETDMTAEPFEEYSPLDALGRCGPAFANVCAELMPSEEREPIGMVRPSGWHTVRYDDLIPDKYLYNRCHLIGFQLTGENDNPRNLITGTRYFNVEGMLPFENRVAGYVRRTGNHVLYRVTPVFQGDDLVAAGVLIEASSVEDRGEGVRFHVFVYNIQPGILIDYATGDSQREPG